MTTDLSARELFGLAFELGDLIEFSSLNHERGGRASVCVTLDEVLAEEQYQERMLCDLNPDGWSAYFGPAPRTTRDLSGFNGVGVDADVEHSRVVWMDIDNAALSQHEDVVARLKDARLPTPSADVFTGGGFQFFWRLISPIAASDVRTVIGSMVAAVEDVVGPGDVDPSVRNPSRIMRLPDSFNRKPQRDNAWAHLLAIRHQPHYSPADFPQDLTRAYEGHFAPEDLRSPKEELALVLSCLELLAGDRCDCYDTWIRVGMAIHSALPDNDGVLVWMDWSAQSEKFDQGQCEYKWATFSQGDGLTLGSLMYWAAEDSGIEYDEIRRRAGLPPAIERTKLTETNDARRLVASYGDDLRWHYARGLWLHFEGRYWAEDTTGEAMRRMKHVASDFFSEAVDLLRKADTLTHGNETTDETENDVKSLEARGKQLMAHAVNLSRKRRLDASLGLAQSESNITVIMSMLDRDPHVLNLTNGTYDLRLGLLRPHERLDLITMMAPVEHDEAASCPRWDQFMQECSAGRPEWVEYLKCALGYALDGTAFEHALLVFSGGGNNGKNTLIETIKHILGPYALLGDDNLLMEKKNEEHPTIFAELRGKRLVYVSETRESQRLRVESVKRLTGDDELAGRFMRQDRFHFPRTFLPILLTNARPRVAEQSHAIWRRLKLVPFDYQVPTELVDAQLMGKLLDERSGILNWLIEGNRQYRDSGLEEPDCVTSATTEYRAVEDYVARFIHEELEFDLGAWESWESIQKRFESWCCTEGIRQPKNRDLRERLKDQGCTQEQESAARRRRGLRGLRLRVPTTPFEGISQR